MFQKKDESQKVISLTFGLRSNGGLVQWGHLGFLSQVQVRTSHLMPTIKGIHNKKGISEKLKECLFENRVEPLEFLSYIFVYNSGHTTVARIIWWKLGKSFQISIFRFIGGYFLFNPKLKYFIYIQ